MVRLTIRIEFQERASPHIHSLIWILSARNIQNKTAHIKFIEQTINAQSLGPVNDLEPC